MFRPHRVLTLPAKARGYFRRTIKDVAGSLNLSPGSIQLSNGTINILPGGA